MAMDSTRSARARRWVLGGLLTVLVILGLLSAAFHSSLAKYDGNFMGLKEDAVVARIGEPYFDDRKTPRGRSDEFLLVWSDPVGHRLILKFKNGVVVGQSRSSR